MSSVLCACDVPTERAGAFRSHSPSTGPPSKGSPLGVQGQTGRDGRIAYGSPRGRWVLAIAVLGSGIVFLDGTVNVALPSIGKSTLVLRLSSLQWISTATRSPSPP